MTCLDFNLKLPLILAISIKNIIMSSFKSSRNIQKKECGPDRSVSDNQSSSVTLNEQAVKAITIYCIGYFNIYVLCS